MALSRGVEKKSRYMGDMTEYSDPEDYLVEDVDEVPADSAFPSWLQGLPERAQPFVTLARLDRPVGIWLLLLPCWMGLAQMRIPTGFRAVDLLWILLFAIGAVAMRGAGCTWNDITDREVDAKVERTAKRPIPSGQVTLNEAYLFLGFQVFIGLLVWLCLPGDAKVISLLALPLVAAYPFMKQITWWPQLFLGFTFNWGVLVGAATAMHVTFASVFLYLGLVAWTVAYDTIYALQDREDDALIGVKSTARLFGDKVLTGIFVFFLAATVLITFSAYVAGAQRLGALLGLAFLSHAIWQMSRLSKSRDENALVVFKSNVWAGAIIVGGLILAALF